MKISGLLYVSITAILFQYRMCFEYMSAELTIRNRGFYTVTQPLTFFCVITIFFIQARNIPQVSAFLVSTIFGPFFSCSPTSE